MMPTRSLFAAALVAALLLFLPLRAALGLADTGISARAVQGSVWGGRLVRASMGGQPLGDLNARLSPQHLFLGQARVRVDGALQGAIVTSFSGQGADIETMNLAVSRSFGPVRLTSLNILQAHVRFRGGDCAEAAGRIMAQVDGALGARLLSGDLKCSGKALAVELLSQSAMERLTLRFPNAGRYEAMLSIRAADTDQATRLAATGFRETATGHILKFSGRF